MGLLILKLKYLGCCCFLVVMSVVDKDGVFNYFII